MGTLESLVSLDNFFDELLLYVILTTYIPEQ